MSENQLIVNRLAMGTEFVGDLSHLTLAGRDADGGLAAEEQTASHARIDIKGIREAIARVEAASKVKEMVIIDASEEPSHTRAEAPPSPSH
ncbi:MAG: hypothetical protein HYR92_06770, partial [Burkholderiales bacterium]|nr:hypothetical protein [Burkholderiales bacterium]